MKKNKMMRIASVLLVAVMLTSCVIAGTFAKYTSSAEGSDAARVAYWGFGADATNELVIDDLFAEAYIDDEVESAGEMENDVSDIIAPGTTNSANFKFAYVNYQDDKITAPEVAYTLDIDTTGSTIADDIKNNANIQWKLDNGSWGTWDQLMTDIEALDGEAATYGPGELPAAFGVNAEHTIAWQWIFSTSADADKVDTDMGNKQVLDQVKIVIKVTATQVDTYSAS